jgi:hypothetical protein
MQKNPALLSLRKGRIDPGQGPVPVRMWEMKIFHMISL